MWIQIINLNKHDFEEAALISNLKISLLGCIFWLFIIRKTATFCGNLRNEKVMNYLSSAVCSYSQGGEAIIRVWMTNRKPGSRHGGTTSCRRVRCEMQKMTSLGKQKRLIEGGQDPRIKGIRTWNDRDGRSIKWRLEPVRHEGYPTGGRRGKPLNPLTEKGPHFQVDVNDKKTAKKGGLNDTWTRN